MKTSDHLNIVIHTPDFPLWDGGISTVAYEYAKTLQGFGHGVTVITPEQTDKDRGWDHARPFSVLRLKKRKAFWLQYAGGLFTTQKFIKRKKIDLLLSFRWNVSGMVCGQISCQFQIPHFQWFHGNELFDRHLLSPRWDSKMRRALVGACLNVCISGFTEGLLKERINVPFQSQVIPLGVDIKRFYPVVDSGVAKKKLGLAGKMVILTLARLVKRKGHDLVIRSLPNLLKTFPNLIYLIAGKGNYESKLKSLVEEMGVIQNVRFDGFVPEDVKASYYQACDFYVMPSGEDLEKGDVEGFGLTFLEANACGKPVIGGRSGGCVEAISHGVSGYLVNPWEPAQVEERLREWIDNPERYREISESALRHVRENYTWEKSTQKVLDAYHQLFSASSS